MSVTSPFEPLGRLRSKQMLELLRVGKRIDGRDLQSYRELKVEPNAIEKAEGSAMVTLGNTKVLVGVKVETGEPYPDTPNTGVLTVNSEFVPLAHEFFEPGPPNENSIELARVVDRGIRESQAIDLEKLVLIPGKLVYVIFVDIYILNHDGNLIDASAYAALSALSSTTVGNRTVASDGTVQMEEGRFQLPLRDYPVACSIAKLDTHLAVDPNLDEEGIASCKITITTTSDGHLCAMQKSGTGTFTLDEILKAKTLALEKTQEIRAKLGLSENIGKN
ncbi:MAG: exosome complex protein Rrp42 [Candidatus Bathyarchaeia archaeon]